jgi:hypothetical protein
MKPTHIYSRLLLAFALFVSAMPLRAQWVRTNGPDSVTVLGNNNVVVGDVYTNVIYAGAVGDVHLSVNYQWEPPQNYHLGSNDTVVLSMVIPTHNSAIYVFAGMSGSGIFRHGINYDFPWVAVNTGLTNLFIHALATFGSNNNDIYAGTEDGLFLSTNLGGNWTIVGTGLAGQTVRAIAFNGSTLLVGTNNGVFLSTNGGTNWTPANNGLTTIDVRALVISGTSIYAGTEGGGVFRSMDNASNWAVVNSGLTNLNVRALTPYGQNVFAGTYGGVFLSTNSGASWQAVNTGLTNSPVRALTVTSSPVFLYAGTLDGTWRRPLSEMVTSIADRSTGTPPYFRLLPTGGLSFTLSTPARVTLTAYKLTGEKAAVLLDERLPAGLHERYIHASALPYGLYIYRLQAGEITETRKVLLAR